ncbi:hypothetical protein [Streptomyces sp. NPDC008001]|uniref:hypothetical protein n=1 Tax=Streptomyces sp. NPDC008001 TaxID=3364804 RepID=UPI0036E6F077
MEAVSSAGRHTVLAITAKQTTGSPVVIETHARVGGDCIPELVELATGQDQYEHAIAALLGTASVRSPAPAAPAAAISCVAPPPTPGTLTGLALTPVDGDLRWNFDRMPGSALSELRSSEDRVGYAIALGATPAEAMETAAKATAGVNLQVSPAP